MIVIGKLFRTLRGHLRRVSWGAVAAALALHMAGTWLLMAWAGEEKLLGWDSFVYYYVTTASTIGYGDLSPGSAAGRWAAALFVMPGAIALFASVLAKTSASLLNFWKRHQVGKMSYEDMHGHTVLIGWHGRESERLVQLLLADTHTDDEGIVLVAEGLAENPLPDQIRFVAAASYADCNEYQRAALSRAARVIVHTDHDDRSLAAVFAVMAHPHEAHVVAHFESAAVAQLVRSHYPHVECTRPLHVDVIARAAQDAGSSLVAGEWLGAGGPTQFSLQVPAAAAPVLAARLAGAFRAQSALWIGYRDGRNAAPVLNPPDHVEIAPGTLLYYLADARIDSARVPWASLAAR
ncbi:MULTISPECIES: potassium channel family protein [unclassified Lysobacter]|uniref:potassium channel family protein n=1 Tax=unclassified Lysobacter TaxID=2635362 RepID=UPI001BE84805|nr:MULTISPECIES: potassium channel family protein [unclassified Lysobacter]MBT2750112.1 two pore domain potassium channel family protein [Lysobacter sp. ISL-50]MBT2775316.1 two pore domain potassium channel family protein [Lysobacter sp. ISL-54]MBT2783439.1 two pore domain potassium channel family protein [Lysobacter sp. ISL-52]